ESCLGRTRRQLAEANAPKQHTCPVKFSSDSGAADRTVDAIDDRGCRRRRGCALYGCGEPRTQTRTANIRE
ncbi:hypothetical protein FRC07_012650, partial [Ceratobasidium sp. 392]